MASTTIGIQNMTRITTDNSTVQTEIFSGFNVFIICIYFAILVVSLIGNGLVIFVTGCKMKTTVNSIWFLNLAIADFIFSLTLIIRAFLDIHSIWHVDTSKCTFLWFMIYLTSSASILLLTTISLDRCLSTWMVVWSRNNRTVFKAKIICVIVSVLSIGFCIPAFINCSATKSEGSYPIQYYKFLVISRFILAFVIPFLIIASSYIAIGVRVKRLKKENQLRSYRVIIAVVLAFFICWLPYRVYKLYYISVKEKQLSDSVKEVLSKIKVVVSFLVFLNSSLNPILYVFMCEEFKKKLKQSLLLVLETAFAEDHLDF
ncbi:C3a anaphylatoxin chemotactic receptor-like [Megalobrama amblycephala]|uniref:C3a anaphylatoxin chemotactic receptor-like n=1 Tax=Megalobrama amblycephala TaxID=75352 RepID=UPI00201430C6|nr:C3a anaphylatoxin chemotactic receptor-like [Megalobrama amblycephala]